MHDRHVCSSMGARAVVVLRRVTPSHLQN
jgi:hypothetical protein